MKISTFSNTPQDRYLEDFSEGTVYEYGPATITEEEIIQFGKSFDPILKQSSILHMTRVL